MRKDMAKVVTERPRRGHGASSKKWGRTLSKDEYDGDDHGPSRAPISRRRQYGWESKDFSDLLGPLRGYLRKQVGRPWNDVWSELSATLDKRSLTGIHIFDHIKWEVELDCYLAVDGKVYRRPRYGSGPIEVDGLYVHPVTGILSSGQQRRPWWRTRNPDLKEHHNRLRGFPVDLAENARYRYVDDLTLLELRPGGWFILKYSDVPERREPIEREDGRVVYRVYPAYKQLETAQQLGKQGLRKYRDLIARSLIVGETSNGGDLIELK